MVGSSVSDTVRQCTFSARLDCHYLLRPPQPAPDSLLVLTLHGFGQTPEMILQLTAKMFDPRHAIASLQGPNEFFLDDQAKGVGCGWVTHRNPASGIRLHHDMVRQV